MRFVLLTILMSTLCLGEKVKLQVKAVDYDTRINESHSSYVIPGRSTTNCTGSANTIGTSTIGGENCQTTSYPAQVQTTNYSTVDVLQVVEADGMRYTMSCRANWAGSNCGRPLLPGGVFRAEYEKPTTMWVWVHRGGNLDKYVKVKYKVHDIRPIEAK